MGLFDGRLSPAHWLSDTTEPIEHPAYLLLAVAQTLAFATAVLARLLAEPMADARPERFLAQSRACAVVAMLAAAGLVLLLFRWLGVPFFSKRVWLLVWWGAVILVIAGVAVVRTRARRGTAAA